MTTQTKVFIELSDIIGLRLQCIKCGCSLLLETEKDSGTINNLLADNNDVLTKCPTCGNGWTDVGRQKLWDSDIKNLFRQMRDLKKVEQGFGCVVSLELAQPSEKYDEDEPEKK